MTPSSSSSSSKDGDIELKILYKATTDKPTIVNLTNHTYWNLSGRKENILDHELQLSCSHYLPVDSVSIPTGEVRPTKKDPAFDFANLKRLGDGMMSVGGTNGDPFGFDHCFVIDGGGGDEDSPTPNHIATLIHRASKRMLILHGTQPGVQVYTANFLSTDPADAPHVVHGAICLETQSFPNAINTPTFPSVTLRPNEVYKHQAIFRFSHLE